MKSFAVFAFIATALSAVSQTFAAPDPNFHIYLAFGQSNMEGAGPIEGQDKTVDKRFQMLSTVSGCGRQLGNWYDATPPLAHCGGKLSPVDYFGRGLIKKLPSEIKVGVVVVAVAGCDIQLFEKNNYKSYNMPDWMRNTVQNYGGNPYGRLVDMAKKAQQAGVIKGILLHQGETNTGQQNWPNRVKDIYNNLLKDLGLNANDVPLLAGEVVSSEQGGSCGSHNAIIAKLPQVIPTAHVISSKGLGHQGDKLHFTSASYRTFGQRYADEMLKILGDVKVEGGSAGGNAGGNTGGNTNQGENNNQGANNNQGGNANPWGGNNNPWGGNNNPWGGNANPWGGNNNNSNNQGANNNQGATNNQSGNDSCWSKSLGFPCCTGKAAVIYTDSNGQWGVENGDWCGIKTSASGCWAKSLGFNCCGTSACRNVVYFDYDGQWDVENGQWCGISTQNTLC